MAAKEATNLCQNATCAHLGRCIDCTAVFLGIFFAERLRSISVHTLTLVHKEVVKMR